MPNTAKTRAAADAVRAAGPLTCGVVIATRNRPEPIGDTLRSLNRQTVLPGTVIVVDSSDGRETGDVVAGLQASLRFPVVYRHTDVRSAARQRNMGAEQESSDIVLFLDDDLELDPACVGEILRVFEDDAAGRIGGVSATITNQVYTDPKGLNRFLLGVCLGRWKGTYAGQLLGPAVNFLPCDIPDTVQRVAWLPSTCTAYRRDVFLRYRFAEFEGYSFAEDVELSSRVARDYEVYNTSRARTFHLDLGKDTHKDWRTLGHSMVVNRYGIMARTMGRHGPIDHLRLFWYEMVYTSIALMASGANAGRLRTLRQLLAGKASAFLAVWTGRLPHTAKPQES